MPSDGRTAFLKTGGLQRSLLCCPTAQNCDQMQGRIKVRGGPRLDTAMGPYPFSFLVKLRYHPLRTLSFWGIAPGKFYIANAHR